jgi:hypothetical protein
VFRKKFAFGTTSSVQALIHGGRSQHGGRVCIRCIFAFAHNATNNIIKNNNTHIYIRFEKEREGVLSAYAAPALGPALLLRADSGSRKHDVAHMPRRSNHHVVFA